MMHKTLSLALLFSSPLLWADEISQSLQQTRQQQAELAQESQARLLKQRQYQAEEKVASEGDFSQVCLDYQGLRFAGISLIDPAALAPQAGECLNEVRLNQLSQQLTQAYLDQGYVHNPFQFEDDQSGFLTLRVFEGKVAQVSSDSKGFRLEQVLPKAVGKPLKIQDLDQALDQANRIPGNQVSVDVLPAQNGEVALAFTNQASSRFAGSIGLDNYASKSYNRWQAKAGLQIGNPLGLSDSLYLNAAHSLKSAKHFSRSALLYYSLPYGYWTFNGFASFSQFKNKLSLANSELEQRGRTVQAGLGADQVFHRGANHISKWSLQLERTDSKNRLEDVVLELQSPKLITLSLGLNHLQILEQGSLIADLRYEQGRNRGQNQPESRIERWNAELHFNHYQHWGQQLFHFSHQLTGQYSDRLLPAVKQEDLTGRYRVRGLNDLGLSAEKSLVLHNNLAWIKQTSYGTISPYLGFDLGLQKSNLADARTERAWAYALGLEAEYKGLQAKLEWARGRLYTKSSGIEQESLVQFSLNYRF
ncbi:hemin-binding protein [Pasteurellaceae bacterium RH1A]|nr:hemin-binding protein [Pasteurellaceae bacterium RH1A]